MSLGWVLMLRVVFTVLAALPLLMPEGMCWCQLLPRRVAGLPPTGPSAAVAQSTPAGPDASEEVSRCSCKRHRKGRTASDDSVSSGEFGAPCHCPSCPDRKQDQHLPGPSGHLPGCPAVHSVPVVLAGAETAGGAVQPLLVSAFADVLPAAVPASPRRQATPAVPHLPSPPLFLSHCALLI